MCQISDVLRSANGALSANTVHLKNWRSIVPGLCAVACGCVGIILKTDPPIRGICLIPEKFRTYDRQALSRIDAKFRKPFGFSRPMFSRSHTSAHSNHHNPPPFNPSYLYHFQIDTVFESIHESYCPTLLAVSGHFLGQQKCLRYRRTKSEDLKSMQITRKMLKKGLPSDLKHYEIVTALRTT